MKPVSIDKVSVPPVVVTITLVLPPLAGLAVNLFSLYPKVGLFPDSSLVARDLSCQYLRNLVTGSYDIIFPTAVDPIPTHIKVSSLT